MNSTTLWPQAILHLDMDAFYVNVHLLDYPQDAGKPLIIGGQPKQRGVVASASYEARQFGIRSAMPCSRAVRLCPHVKIVPANWSRIRACSEQVMTRLATYGPLEKVSVDEAYIEMSHHANPVAMASKVQTAVYTEMHLPCSVGLATSKLVAKVASDHDKPQGCVIVLPGDEADFLAPLSVRVIWGIGPKTAKKLARLQIDRCGQLAKADLGQLQSAFGGQALDMQQRAQGIDRRNIQTEHGPPKSISQEWTFSVDVNEATQLQKKLHKMSQTVAASLQKRHLVAHTVTVKFRWADFTTFTRQKSVAVGVDTAEEIARLATAIWQEHWPTDQYMRLIGVGVSNLQETAVRQLGFGF